ncbi:PAAR domain-containing protein [Burkholderia pseudomultivorans]|uniref:PAAR domain-containing protein n=1 Tax=Burkholderia pseudomultivorans TaxID=1207504 RepID=UPI003AF5173F
MNRRIAVVGDGLSSGGTIAPYGGPRLLVHGHQAALIGGRAFCAACKTTGIIAKAGGPYRLRFQGEVALEHDIVLCGCSTPPSIVAVLAGEAWCDDRLEGLGEVVSSRTSTDGVVSLKKGAFDEQIEAATRDSISGGWENYPYYIETVASILAYSMHEARYRVSTLATNHTTTPFTGVTKPSLKSIAE